MGMTLLSVELRYDCRSHRGEQASIGGGSTYQVKYMTRYQDDKLLHIDMRWDYC